MAMSLRERQASRPADQVQRRLFGPEVIVIELTTADGLQGICEVPGRFLRLTAAQLLAGYRRADRPWPGCARAGSQMARIAPHRPSAQLLPLLFAGARRCRALGPGRATGRANTCAQWNGLARLCRLGPVDDPTRGIASPGCEQYSRLAQFAPATFGHPSYTIP